MFIQEQLYIIIIEPPEYKIKTRLNIIDLPDLGQKSQLQELSGICTDWGEPRGRDSDTVEPLSL